MKSINLTAAVVALGLCAAVQGQQSGIDGDAQAIAARMDEVLRNEQGLSRGEVERNLAELEAALRRAAAEQQDAEPFDALTEDSPFEAPAADGYDIGEHTTSESRSDEDVLGGEDGDDHAMPYGGDGLFGDDGAVAGFNDGSGSDEPDMGICDAGGMPAWCLDDWDIDDDVAVNSSDGGAFTDEPDMSICDAGGEPAWCVE